MANYSNWYEPKQASCSYLYFSFFPSTDSASKCSIETSSLQYKTTTCCCQRTCWWKKARKLKRKKRKIENRLKSFEEPMGALELDDEVLCGFVTTRYLSFFFLFFHSHALHPAPCIILFLNLPINRHRHYKLCVSMAGELCHIKI